MADEEIRLEILDQIGGLTGAEMGTLLIESFTRFHEKLSTESLGQINVAISRELSKRQVKDSVTLLKEWADKKHERKVLYKFMPLEPGNMAGRVTIFEGKKNWSCAAVYQDQLPGVLLQKPLKKRLAQMALDKLKEREVELEEVKVIGDDGEWKSGGFQIKSRLTDDKLTSPELLELLDREIDTFVKDLEKGEK